MTTMNGEIVSVSPADPSDEIGRFATSDAKAVGAAVARSRDAFPAWRDLEADARAAFLRRFAEIAAERKEELAHLIAREVGKALWDARGEAALIAAKVAVSLGPGMDLVAPVDVGGGARATHHPRGVLAVLGPFNFPAHLPNGHIVPALATGNTVVFKPSEIAPAVGEWMAAAWRDAGLPEGVFQCVHGGADTGRALALDEDVDGVLFTGSSGAGRALQEATLDQPGKILALEMGGKNAIAVLADAELDLAVAETALSIAVTTGQRCTCASRVFVAESLADAFTEKLARTLGGITVGPPLEEGVFMGPLASQAAYDKVVRMRAAAAEGGGERIELAQPRLPPPFVGPGLARFRTAEQNTLYQREEIFGPEAALYPVVDLEEAIAAINDSDYGLAGALFTSDEASYRHAIGRVRTGIFNWNKGTTGASGKLPFGGLGKSGNDRPAGLWASLYCTSPQSHLESAGGFDPATLPPGMPRP